MSTISDSSQEASNAAINTGQTPVLSPNIFLKSEIPDIQRTSLFQSPDILKPSPLSTDQSQKRRSSSRSIKRKKFDDELVESSLIKTSRPRPQNTVFPLLTANVSLAAPSIVPSLIATPTTSTQALNEATPVLSLEKRKSRPTPKRSSKKPKSGQAHLAKDVSRWKPVDDLALILSVQQANDLETVHRGVKFSSKFLLREVQERWYALLYDTAISKPALFAIKQLNAETIAQTQANVLFSEDEEKLVSNVSSDKGCIETFQELLDSNASTFLPSRTAKALHTHWSMMKQFNLLHDQRGQQVLNSENLITLSDTEELLDDAELQDAKDAVLDEETSGAAKRHLATIKQLESEVPKWQVLVDCITGISVPDFDSRTLAVLKGRIVRYLIQSREVSFGRAAQDNHVDIDLSLEGPSWKISRRQGYIKLDSNGDFYLTNEGKKPIFVDGKPVVNGSKYKVSNNSNIEITVLRFIFIVNFDAINSYKPRYPFTPPYNVNP